MKRYGINWIRIDMRCPDCGADNVLIVPDGVWDNPSDRLKCKARLCGKWHGMRMLKLLRSDAFAPPRMAGHYVGAVMRTEINDQNFDHLTDEHNYHWDDTWNSRSAPVR